MNLTAVHKDSAADLYCIQKLRKRKCTWSISMPKLGYEDEHCMKATLYLLKAKLKHSQSGINSGVALRRALWQDDRGLNMWSDQQDSEANAST